MLYNDLDKIPLDIFIDVFTGDNSKLIIEENIQTKSFLSKQKVLSLNIQR